MLLKIEYNICVILQLFYLLKQTLFLVNMLPVTPAEE